MPHVSQLVPFLMLSIGVDNAFRDTSGHAPVESGKHERHRERIMCT